MPTANPNRISIMLCSVSVSSISIQYQYQYSYVPLARQITTFPDRPTDACQPGRPSFYRRYFTGQTTPRPASVKSPGSLPEPAVVSRCGGSGAPRPAAEPSRSHRLRRTVGGGREGWGSQGRGSVDLARSPPQPPAGPARVPPAKDRTCTPLARPESNVVCSNANLQSVLYIFGVLCMLACRHLLSQLVKSRTPKPASTLPHPQSPQSHCL